MASSDSFQGITVLGLGPGSPDLLTGEASAWIARLSEIYLITAQHPAAAAFPDSLIVHSFDDLLEYSATLEEAAEKIAAVVLELGQRPQGVTYAVPGHPLVGEYAVQLIIEAAHQQGIPLRIIHGISAVQTACALLEIDPWQRLTVMSAAELQRTHVPGFPPSIPTLITQVSSRKACEEILRNLSAVYPADHPVRLIHCDNQGAPQIENLPLSGIGQSVNINPLTFLYVPPISADASFESFQEVIARLRAPDGCPWDREQTHASLRSSLLEETYEALTALDANDPAAMREEFGDLLLQIVMHAQIASEAGEFNMVDIVQNISRKLVYRHPHVFGTEAAENTDDVLKNWEKLKAEERKHNGKKKDGMLAGVPVDYPALSQAQEYQKRARRVGFDWDSMEGVLDKVMEELQELKQSETPQENAEELGDLLFSVVNLARWYKVDAESALRETNLKFKRRFQYVEQRAAQQGRSLSDMTLAEMDVFWDEAKGLENK